MALGFGIGIRGVRNIGEIAARDRAEFGADYIGGKAGREQAAIEGGEFAPVERAAEAGEAALEAGADEGGFVGFGEDGVERGFDVGVGDAAGAEFAGDAEAAAVGMDAAAGEVEGVADVIEIVELAKARDDGGDEFYIFGAAFEIGAHVVERVGAAHKRALRGKVKLVLGREFRGRGAGTHVGI